MLYLFMDESGCLGFDFSKQGTSKYFVITCFFVEHKRTFEKIIKKVYNSLPKKVKRKCGVLHCCKEKPETRKKLLKMVSEKECKIMSIYLNKRKVYTKLQDEKHVLYNYVTNILLDRIYSKKLFSFTNEIHLIAAKRETNKFLNENFKDYLSKQVSNVHNCVLKVFIATPHQEKCLQIVDFISWSIFRKYNGDTTYYDIIKNNIVEENPLFP